MKIVDEEPTHRAAVQKLNDIAFCGRFESGLIARLDRDGLVVSSLVAVEQGEVIGHILFSKLDVRVQERPVAAVALAPMCVATAWQRRGVGSRLVEAGIEAVRAKGAEAIIVLGHEGFYPRFGLRHDLVRNLDCPFAAYPAFMGLELAPGCLAGRTGVCVYPAAFGEEARLPRDQRESEKCEN